MRFKGRKINSETLGLEEDLKTVKQFSAESQRGSRNKDKQLQSSVRVFGKIVRILNKTKPRQTIVLSAYVVDTFQKRNGKLSFFAYCDKHGYGKYRIKTEAVEKDSGNRVYILQCVRCASEGRGQKSKKQRKSLFETVFKIFKRG